MRLGRCAQCDGFVNTSDAECPNCGDVQSASSRAVVTGITRAAVAAGAVVTLMACYGGPPPPSQPLYSPCGPEGVGGQCILGACRQSVLDSTASFCTMECSATGASCPTADGRVGVCIENGSGQCFQRCVAQADCDPYGMTCRLATGTERVCVPDFPGAILPYAVCGSHGFRCALGSTCEPTSIPAGPFNTSANHCTRDCTVDADCAYQGVCAAGQCYLRCDPTRIDAGDACAGAPGPATYTCMPTPDGARSVCVPRP